MSADELERRVIHRSVNRPVLFFGGDGPLMKLSVMISGTLIIFILDWRSAIAGVVFWIVSVYLLRRMAKADPYARDVFMRNRRYKSYYPARPTPYRVIDEAANKRRMRNPWKR